ncbi:MAG: hypothetical protein KY432_03410 [Acidobacteria bacterium]|nr:hypothetical protein [Acidobacteriota bacterium]
MEKRAFGTDRLKVGEDGALYLSCRHPKDGWVARREADNVHREFPGTCVRWEEEFFEIVSIEQLPVGVRYGLAPWSESHTMRTVVDYDEPSELKREEDRLAESSRQSKAAGFSLFAVVTGLLPADTQLELERELGVSATTATFVSAVIPFLIGGASLIFLMASSFGGNPFGLPSWLYLVGIYFWIEAMIRLGVVLGQSRPVGSFPIVMIWEILAALRGKRPLRAPQPKLKWELDEATLDRDAFVQREPFLALLSPAEQQLMADRYGFDWSTNGKKSAWVLLSFAVFVAAVAATDVVRGDSGAGDVVTVLIMGYLIWEQIVRMQRIGAGRPAGSLLGVFVRPLTKKLLVSR